VALLFVARVFLGTTLFPPALAAVLVFVVSVAFVALPIFGLFQAASHSWTAKPAWLLLAGGAVIHAAAALLLRSMPPSGLPSVIVEALGQVGLSGWTLGLGVLVAMLIKDKNMILPIAVFLAGFDIFLVFSPKGPTAKFIEAQPEVFQSIAMSVPTPRPTGPEAPAGAAVQPMAFVGPADLFFVATFFVCLYRFKMRVAATAKWLVPVMAAYLLVVLLPTGLGMLPALVPIGATVLLVNRGQFKLSRDEAIGTAMAVGLAVMLAGYGIYSRVTHKRTEPPSVPSSAAPVPNAATRPATPAPDGLDRSR
jgi:hypothetical protein